MPWEEEEHLEEAHAPEVPDYSEYFEQQRLERERAAQAERERQAYRNESIDLSTLPDQSYSDVAKQLDAGYDTKAHQKPNEKLGDLSSMSDEQRLAVLNKLTQNQAGNKDSEFYCGPTAIIAAAMMGGGNEGMVKLISQLQSDGDAKDEKKQEAMKALMERAAKGELDTKDISGLQKDLYADLRERDIKEKMRLSGLDREAAIKELSVTDKDGKSRLQDGVSGHGIDSFMYQSHLMDYMKDADGHQVMMMDRIDNSANDKEDPGHWILKMNAEGAGQKYRYSNSDDGFNAIFDPYDRKDGNQVTQSKDNADLMKTYMNAKSADMRVDGNYEIREGYAKGDTPGLYTGLY